MSAPVVDLPPVQQLFCKMTWARKDCGSPALLQYLFAYDCFVEVEEHTTLPPYYGPTCMKEWGNWVCNNFTTSNRETISYNVTCFIYWEVIYRRIIHWLLLSSHQLIVRWVNCVFISGMITSPVGFTTLQISKQKFSPRFLTASCVLRSNTFKRLILEASGREKGRRGEEEKE